VNKLLTKEDSKNITQRCAVAKWLRYYATNSVAGSIPDGVIGIFR